MEIRNPIPRLDILFAEVIPVDHHMSALSEFTDRIREVSD